MLWVFQFLCMQKSGRKKWRGGSILCSRGDIITFRLKMRTWDKNDSMIVLRWDHEEREFKNTFVVAMRDEECLDNSEIMPQWPGMTWEGLSQSLYNFIFSWIFRINIVKYRQADRSGTWPSTCPSSSTSKPHNYSVYSREGRGGLDGCGCALLDVF